MGASHKIYGVLPEENTKADIFPGRYFNFVFDNIRQAEGGLNVQDYDDGCQYLLVNLDILIMLSKRYPNVVARKIYTINRKQLKETFFAWYKRNEKKMPAKYRAGIKESADNLFNELLEIKSWTKSE
jgi:hypothetical protein